MLVHRSVSRNGESRMMRLVKAGLMFGNLYEVSSPALVERYNRALEHLTGKRTELTEFHIDIVGASPEVAHELGDELYLNPHGANQMFILLSTDQKTAPLLNLSLIHISEPTRPY